MADRPEPAQAFIVGAQRCGTTSVAVTLAQHPEVALARPLRPEPKWFLDPGASDRVPAYLATYFGDVGPATRLRLEKSTSYLESDIACAEIARAFPEAEVIVVLRDPVARAVSHYGFSVAHGQEALAATDALEPGAEDRPWNIDEVSVSPFRYLSRGRYIDDLRRWDDRFGPDAVHIAILEDLIAEPERFVELEAALGLAPGPRFVPDARHNAGEGAVTLDDGTRARLAGWFADANADLAERLGRPIERWTHA